MLKKITILMVGFFTMVIVILLLGSFIFFNNVIKDVTNNERNYNCDNLNVIYLKASEKSIAGEVARNIQGIAVIPEENYLVADTRLLLECKDIDFSDYIEMGDFK